MVKNISQGKYIQDLLRMSDGTPIALLLLLENMGNSINITNRPFVFVPIAVFVLFAAIIVGTYHSTNLGLTITQAFKPPYICTSYISYGLRFV